MQTRRSDFARQVVMSGNFHYLEGLLKRGQVDPNTRMDADANTLLHGAMGYVNEHFNQHGTVRVLGNAGANVNARNLHGMTPLDVAMARTSVNLDVVKDLLHFGADVTPAAAQRADLMARQGDRSLIDVLQLRNLKPQPQWQPQQWQPQMQQPQPQQSARPTRHVRFA